MSTVLTILKKYVTKRPVTQATVVKVEQVSQHFRVIELVCDTPFKTAVLPGDKISITADGKQRCYTPLAVEGDTSRISLGIHLHGKGPGSAWAFSVKVSDEDRAIGGLIHDLSSDPWKIRKRSWTHLRGSIGKSATS
ncbi:SIP domain-containing protein [Granulicella paludicola]|uniref:siderophore-interacting protein n=1 Tax=Granulicella paludicola TaxID=474951 RepID=UPI0021DFE3F5|nr:siderophore-interacting protein [Granulicella paludicola]